ncbi:MAG: DUF4398 domain-containing protein [Treponema sp.]|nr:DUF4398 domain-containing protein [Treponema sp.]MCL2252510.1 DUF4398 domain-containing protein [Treponema sp.]
MDFKPNYILSIFLALVMSVSLLGCEKPPLAEMENARERVFQADNDPDASLYAAGTLARAKNALRQMQDEADNKRYDAARTYAAEAISLAERALLDGRLGASRASEAASDNNLVSDLRKEIESTERNVNGARYNQMVLDYDELDKAIVNVHNRTDQVESDQAEGRYQQALDRAGSVRADLAEINQKVAGAVKARKK